eukprot:2363368-Pyramimonas_sp.AAC.2
MPVYAPPGKTLPSAGAGGDAHHRPCSERGCEIANLCNPEANHHVISSLSPMQSALHIPDLTNFIRSLIATPHCSKPTFTGA